MKFFITQKASFSKTVSESDVYMFAGITGDFNPVHMNKCWAEKTVFGERIVHGALVSGLVSTVIGMDLPGPGTIYMEQDSCFLAPAHIGDTLYAEVEVAEILNAGKGILKLDTRVYNQDDIVILKGYAIVKAPMEEN